MMQSQRECVLCHNDVTPDQIEDAFIEQTVFVHGPKKNGATLAQDTGRHAHKECVEKAQAGIPADMPSLFDLPDPDERRCKFCHLNELAWAAPCSDVPDGQHVSEPGRGFG